MTRKERYHPPKGPEVNETLNQYYKEIGRYPLLSRDEEAALAKEIKQGNEEALEKLARSNLRFVVTVARKYQNRGMTLKDLIGEGNVGLIRAIQKFDETKKVRFISYAVWWIRQAIFQALSEQSRLYRIPLNRVSQIKETRRTENRLAQELGHEPTLEQLAEKLDLEPREVRKLRIVDKWPFSLDEPPPGHDDVLHEYLASEDDTEKAAFEAVRRGVIKSLLSELSEREAFILRKYFDLDQQGRMTLEEIGNILGITRERVRQIKERAIERLQHISRRKKLEPFLTP